MWNRWQGRRLHPSEYYKGFNVSTSWASYVTQLVYYTCQSFNSDPGWMNLFVQGAPRPVTRPSPPASPPASSSASASARARPRVAAALCGGVCGGGVRGAPRACTKAAAPEEAAEASEAAARGVGKRNPPAEGLPANGASSPPPAPSRAAGPTAGAGPSAALRGCSAASTAA